mgnify:CR=1 FL=1
MDANLLYIPYPINIRKEIWDRSTPLSSQAVTRRSTPSTSTTHTRQAPISLSPFQKQRLGTGDANIDEYLGFHHEISVDVEIPAPALQNKAPHGRVNTTEREAGERKNDFQCIECGLTAQGAMEESSRCPASAKSSCRCGYRRRTGSRAGRG